MQLSPPPHLLSPELIYGVILTQKYCTVYNFVCSNTPAFGPQGTQTLHMHLLGLN